MFQMRVYLAGPILRPQHSYFSTATVFKRNPIRGVVVTSCSSAVNYPSLLLVITSRLKKISPALLRPFCRSHHAHMHQMAVAHRCRGIPTSRRRVPGPFFFIHQSFRVPHSNPSSQLIPHMRFNPILSHARFV
jgi:hypothetical protein